MPRPRFRPDSRGQAGRHARPACDQALFYNKALLEEKGIKAPPTTIEELVDQAKQLTFTSKAGTPVVGMVLASDLAVFPVMFARAFGGDFITREFKLVPDAGAMEKALAVLKACSRPARCRAAMPRPKTTIR